jgi:hypothetical protein
VVEARAMFRRADRSAFGGPTNLANALIASNAVPSNYISADQTSIRSPWGKTVRVGSEDKSLHLGLPAGTLQTMTLRLEDVPPKVCARLATFKANGNGILGDGILYLEISNGDIPYTGMSYGQTVLDRGGSAGTDPQIGLTPAEAGESCAAAAEGGSADLEIWFGWDS